ncbi:MAG: class I SAM-dependent methyltransferase [Gammaproteobacteria bacterium]|nr:class I SAM-dependent methyltransferase [Gammaproteobacteria bacterium]
MKPEYSNSLLFIIALCVLPFNASQADAYDDLIQAAVDNPARLEASRNRDALRKPAEVIKFMGVEPGMTVLDLVAIGGYYTEILAGVVGENGRIISHALAANGMDPDYAFAAHIRNSRHLDNVVPIYADMKDLDLEENTVDQIFLIQNFHDLYFERWGADPDTALSMFRKVLKPGGTLAVVDHVAPDDAPSSTGDTTHRISKPFTTRTLEAAGFVLEAESDMLLNNTDDINKLVFAPDIRGKTSRFVQRYSNP